MKTMNIVVPMAGLGSRFSDAGYSLPKPLIDVLGRPMYAWAVDSLPLECSQSLIFILLKSQPEYEVLKNDIHTRYSAYSPIVETVNKLTRGQAETVLSVRELIDNDLPLLIHNADTGFEISPDWLVDLERTKPDGALLVFESNEHRWSYSRADSSGHVVEVREKKIISQWASTGTYYFGKGTDFVRLAAKRLVQDQPEAGEFYIAPLYNDLIAEKGIVRNYKINRLFCFGTPLDLNKTVEMLSSEN